MAGLDKPTSPSPGQVPTIIMSLHYFMFENDCTSSNQNMAESAYGAFKSMHTLSHTHTFPLRLKGAVNWWTSWRYRFHDMDLFENIGKTWGNFKIHWLKTCCSPKNAYLCHGLTEICPTRWSKSSNWLGWNAQQHAAKCFKGQWLLHYEYQYESLNCRTL